MVATSVGMGRPGTSGRPKYRPSVARFEMYASQQPRAPHAQGGPSMESGTWPNSPATLCRPRSSSPRTVTPTPTPSETLTKTRSAGGFASPRADHMSASAQALPEFSIWTGRPVAAARERRRGMSRQPSAGACTTFSPSRSIMPGTTTPIPAQRPRSRCSESSRFTRPARSFTKRAGSSSVAKLPISISWRPTRSVIIR